MTDRFADFDAAFAEEAASPVVVHIYGRDWELPSSLPAGAVLKVARYMAEGKAQTEMTGAEMMDLARDIIPGEILDAWCAKGLGVDQLGQVIKWVMSNYMVPGGDQGEALAPATTGAEATSPASSATGDSSKPTSPASTAST